MGDGTVLRQPAPPREADRPAMATMTANRRSCACSPAPWAAIRPSLLFAASAEGHQRRGTAADRAGSMALLHDRQLGIVDLERLEFSGAALLVFGSDGVADDTDWRRLRHDPFSDPELALGLRGGCPVAHGKIKCLASIAQMYNELGGLLPL